MKNILMIPSWYPTKTNPINGSFFREQALALASDFNFHVGFVEFRRENLLRFIIRICTFRLKAHIGNLDLLQSPKAVSFIGYGLNLNKIEKFIPVFLSDNFLKWINEKLELKTYIKMYLYFVENLNFKPDLIYAMTSIINGVPAYKLGLYCKTPVALAEHIPFNIEAIPFHSKKSLKKALENADSLLVVSYDKARQILMGNIDCLPIVVGNMVDENIFSLKPDKKSGFIPTILIVAAYNFYKDYTTFFKAMSHLRKITDKKFKINIIGIAPNTSKSMWAEGEEKFYDQFKRHDLSDITEIINFVSRDKMINYYHQSDLFMLTSIQEGLPVSLLEAMACGLPVFSTRCGGVEDFLDDECGRLYHLRDFKSMAEDIKEWLEGRITFDKNTIRQKVIQYFGVEAFKKRMKKVFDHCIANYNHLN